MANDFFTMVGFAAKAGACVYGTFAVEKGAKKGKILLVLLDEGLSEKTKKNVCSMCGLYDIPFIVTAPRDKLGNSCGKQNKLIGVTQKVFADRMTEIFKNSENCSEV